MKSKNEVHSIFLSFRNLAENLFNSKICYFQSDWGGEFRTLQKSFSDFGIHHRISCPHTHTQNGTVERRHRTIVEKGLALIHHSNLPNKYWSYAFTTAAYLINRLPSPTLQNKSPYQIIYKTKPNYNFLKVFGCLCWPNLRPYTKNKLEPRSTPCIFLGYSPNHIGYLCLDPKTNKIYTSKDVIFDETSFFFKSPNYPLASTQLYDTPQSTKFSLPLLIQQVCIQI